MPTFIKEMEKLQLKFIEEMKRQPKHESGGFVSDTFAETGRILFAGQLPDDYPFVHSHRRCWSSLSEVEDYIEEKRPERAKRSAHYWDDCIEDGYRDTPPRVAKRLRECFVNMGLLTIGQGGRWF